jgi:hypothetical protein
LFLFDANRRPLSEAYGFAAEMLANAFRVVGRNKYFPKNWMAVKDLGALVKQKRDVRTTRFELYS